jgi:deoxyuridine 5''-triphosphate nucleotidohydrolase (dut)
MFTVKFKKLVDDARAPEKYNLGDAAYDLFSIENHVVEPNKRCLVKTGICIELPPNTEAQIRPRSGLAIKHGITVLNTPGTIDEPYRGEIGVIIINHGEEAFYITKHMRIAQMLVKPIYETQFVEAKELSASSRGLMGFGSSGIANIGGQRNE